MNQSIIEEAARVLAANDHIVNNPRGGGKAVLMNMLNDAHKTLERLLSLPVTPKHERAGKTATYGGAS